MNPTAESDGQLLARFAQSGQEAAFELVLRRHGALVLNVCRRVLGHTQDAEDAAQAVFLVLARKAGALSQASSAAPWLARVAHQVALNAAQARATRRKHEQRAPAMSRPVDSIQQPEFKRVLDAELDTLPEKYRKAIVLHYLAGHSESETAQLLGCPQGTACTWLARGRELLRERLARRGLVLSAVLVGSFLSAEAGAAELPAAFVSTTLRAIHSPLTGKVAAAEALAQAVSPQVVALSEGVLKTMFWSKVKVACLALISASLIGSITGFAAWRAMAEDKPAAKDQKKVTQPATKTEVQMDAERAKRAVVVLRVVQDEKPAPGSEPAPSKMAELRVIEVLKDEPNRRIDPKLTLIYSQGLFPLKKECTVYLSKRQGSTKLWLLDDSVEAGVSHISQDEAKPAGPLTKKDPSGNGTNSGPNPQPAGDPNQRGN